MPADQAPQPNPKGRWCSPSPWAPRLSLLLAAWKPTLSPQPAALPDPAAMGGRQPPHRCGPACRLEQCLEAAQGELAWPPTPPLPPLALLPVLLRLDARASTSCNWLGLGGCTLSSDDPLHQELGCLAGQTSWWKRLLPLSANEPDATLLLDLRRRAAHRGAGLCSCRWRQGPADAWEMHLSRSKRSTMQTLLAQSEVSISCCTDRSRAPAPAACSC